jgi:serine/threonine protein kinase
MAPTSGDAGPSGTQNTGSRLVLRSVSDSETSFGPASRPANSDPGLFLGSCRSVDEFQKLNRIGEGTYGIVYRAKDSRSGEIVALKKVRMENETDGLPLSSLREISMLKSLKHRNIVRVIDVVVGSALESIFMGMEYCEQDLANLMDNVPTPYSTSESGSRVLSQCVRRK